MPLIVGDDKHVRCMICQGEGPEQAVPVNVPDSASLNHLMTVVHVSPTRRVAMDAYAAVTRGQGGMLSRTASSSATCRCRRHDDHLQRPVDW